MLRKNRQRFMKHAFDCIVIGGGHNGLIAAAYLAKSGKSVCLLERRELVGGCTVTEELWPGYHVSTASYVVSLLLPEIIRDLRLKQNGLEILPRSPSSFTPLLDDRYLLMGPDMGATCEQIAKFSRPDAENYPRYTSWLEQVAEKLEPVLAEAAPDPLPLPKSWRKIRSGKRFRDARRMWSLYQAMQSLGEKLPESIELITGAVRPLLDRWFESEILRATLATDGVIGAFSSISSPGTAYVLLHHVMGEAGGARGVWGYIRGGMGGLARSLEKVCCELGVEIIRGAEVERIATHNGAVTGVVTSDHRYWTAPVVASSVDANLTFLKFLEPSSLPDSFRQAIERIDYSSASAKINLALSEPPRFRALPTDGIGPHHHGTMHICPTLDYIERAYADARAGRPSDEPILEITLPSSVDDTLAPSGKHVMSIFVQYAPYELAEGSWDEIKEPFADRCLEVLGRYAPNIPGAVEHRQVLSPLDLERIYGLTGGNIMQGAMPMHQLFFCRPVPGWADHRTPISGLFLCGAASHPGGGVMGACGRNAAKEILRDH